MGMMGQAMPALHLAELGLTVSAAELPSGSGSPLALHPRPPARRGAQGTEGRAHGLERLPAG